MNRRLVLGIGNLLLGDEGAGVRVVEQLQMYELPDDVDVVDGGTGGADLVDILAGRPSVIVVDALDAGAPPGSVFRLGLEQLAPTGEAAVSLHEWGLLESIWTTRLLGCPPGEVVVFGIQPKEISPGLELSPEVALAVDRTVRTVIEELGSKSCPKV